MKRVLAILACLSLSAIIALSACHCKVCEECVCQNDNPKLGADAAAFLAGDKVATTDAAAAELKVGAANTKAQRHQVVQESDNLLVNPSFEAGLEGWHWLDWSKGWAAFALSYEQAYDGQASLHLPVRSMDTRSTVVWGGVQELTLQDSIPECVEGYFMVKNWQHHDWKQYLQLVIIDRSHNLGQDLGQAQLRYIISGSVDAPLQISNARYLFVEKTRQAVPPLDKWTHFSVNPRKDYQESWQYIPQAGAELRVLFEGRFDQRRPGQAPAHADVYFDNLYMGPKTATRCVE